MVREVTERKTSLISALYANSGIDGDGRTNAINELEQRFSDIVEMIETGHDPEAEPLPEMPFFQRMRVPGEELLDVETKVDERGYTMEILVDD